MGETEEELVVVVGLFVDETEGETDDVAAMGGGCGVGGEGWCCRSW